MKLSKIDIINIILKDKGYDIRVNQSTSKNELISILLDALPEKENQCM